MNTPPFATIQLNNRPQVYNCEPRWSPQPLPDFDLWCVFEGEGEMRLGEAIHPLSPGVGFVIPPGATPIATQNIERRLVVFAVHFYPLDTAGQLSTLSPFPLTYRLQDLGFFVEMAYRCQAAGARGGVLGEHQARLFVEQMLLQILEEADRADDSPVDARLREIVREIRSAPGKDWSVEEQAVRACLSRSQYTRRFTALMGVSPTQFVVQTRLERAAQLLRETDMTLQEIASVLGYRDPFFFSRQFRQHRGVTPGSVRGVGSRQ
jgi:AraC family transcriptional regulator, arabinose operon regulatory protein